MKNVAVFTPTNRFGIDLSIFSLKRQTYPYLWILADELMQERIPIYEEQGMIDNIVFVECNVIPGNKRALAQAYNNAADLAIDMNFDLLISMQDYLWIPDNGIEMFAQVHQTFPSSLITGLVSLSEAPRDDEIEDTSGLFSIFKKPLTGRPIGISWHDVRDTHIYTTEDSNAITSCTAEHWEANWAAIPVELFRKGARWDLEYDKGMAYENIDFAKTGFPSKTIIQGDNFELICGNCKQVAFRKTPVLIQQTTTLLFGTV